MLRNFPGPYNVSPGVGYDKNYHYDWNLRFNPPPYYPDQVDVNNNVILKILEISDHLQKNQLKSFIQKKIMAFLTEA